MVMMYNTLPQSIKVHDKMYPINTDFRTWIDICVYLEDENFSFEEKILKLLCDAYTKELPPDIESATNALLEFMMGKKKGESSRGGASDKIFDFSVDEGLIYASFMQQYGIDLYTATLHWWSFIHLLSGLDENTAFMKVIGYRTINIEKIKNKDLKMFYRRMKNKYRLYECIADEEIASALDSVMC